MATTLRVRVPEEIHVVICRGKEAETADHEIVPACDLKTYVSSHIARHLKVHFGSVRFDWLGSADWRLFLQGETVKVIVSSEDEEVFSVAIARRNNPDEMTAKRIEKGK